MRPCNDVVAKDNDGSHREFIDFEAPLGFSQRFANEVVVELRHALMIRGLISPIPQRGPCAVSLVPDADMRPQHRCPGAKRDRVQSRGRLRGGASRMRWITLGFLVGAAGLYTARRRWKTRGAPQGFKIGGG